MNGEFERGAILVGFTINQFVMLAAILVISIQQTQTVQNMNNSHAILQLDGLNIGRPLVAVADTGRSEA